MLPDVSRFQILLFAVCFMVLAALGVLLYMQRQQAPVAGTELTSPVQISGLQLVDQRGQMVNLANDFGGKVTLVFFGYTRCPDICPLTMARLAQAYEGLADRSGLQSP